MKHGKRWGVAVWVLIAVIWGGMAAGRPAEAAAGQQVTVLVNEHPVSLPGDPMVVKGVTLVPFRALFEALGFKVEYRPEDSAILGSRGDLNLTLQIGSGTALINGEQKPLLAAPILKDGSAWIPLRFVAEATGKSVMRVGNVIYIRNLSYIRPYWNEEGSSSPKAYTDGTHIADYIGEDAAGNLYVYYKERSGQKDQLYVSVAQGKNWTVRDRKVALLPKAEELSVRTEWVQGNRYLVRDAAGLRCLELLPDGSVGRDYYLDKTPAGKTSGSAESVRPLYWADGGRGVIYQQEARTLLYRFDDPAKPVAINRPLTGGELWSFDPASGFLLKAAQDRIDVYDSEGRPTYGQDGKPNTLRIQVAENGTIKHILYDNGTLYYAVQVRTSASDYIRIEAVRLKLQKQTTYVQAEMSQDYKYRMSFTIANNWSSLADVIGKQIHIYCNTLYDAESFLEIGVMEMD
ncbi:copper amine oxidase N-terminal domain-containing protein [Paenibacillus glufosinatiresistens]|uniref:copper amine oxidase N-terminal domain-containing protein n=1 Tax=Paenibacillus glufosinatiresistens TaxID=3070657 RepID=UPI00286E2E68|nr:copper amine oxidase N-terminal domain-containing protein [Paenibacillus sp. YX.27]